jgi:universal stress protein E
MAKIDRILAVVDPTSEAQPAAERAAWLAQKLGAGLELFICDYDQYLAGERFFDSTALAKARSKMIDNHRSKLAEIADSIAPRKIRVSIDARWDYPLEEGIIRKAIESSAELVVKDTHFHTAIRRSIFTNTDWALIRACPVPLLLVKPRDIGEHRDVIAAVDPVHEHDKPASLDQKILDYAVLLSDAIGGDLEVFHGFDPSPAYAVSADSLAFPISVPISGLSEALRGRHEEAMDALLATRTIDRSNVHILEGATRELLVSMAEKHNAAFVVMGAVSRGALQRLLVGSTAEQVLDFLPCDTLIVKPEPRPSE